MANQPQTVIANLVKHYPDVARTRIGIALQRTEGSLKAASTLFGVAPATLGGYLRTLGIDRSAYRPAGAVNREIPAFLADLFDAEGNVVGDGSLPPEASAEGGEASAEGGEGGEGPTSETIAPKRRR